MKFKTMYIMFISLLFFIITVCVIIILKHTVSIRKKEKYLADYMDYKYCRCNGKNTNYNYNTSY